MLNISSRIMDIFWTVYPGLWIYAEQFIQDYGYYWKAHIVVLINRVKQKTIIGKYFLHNFYFNLGRANNQDYFV